MCYTRKLRLRNESKKKKEMPANVRSLEKH